MENGKEFTVKGTGVDDRSDTLYDGRPGLSEDYEAEPKPGGDTYPLDNLEIAADPAESPIDAPDNPLLNLHETSSEERKARLKQSNMQINASRDSYVVYAKQVTVSALKETAKGAAKGGVQVLENFDTIFGAISYLVVAIAYAHYQQGNLNTSLWLAALGLILVIAKRRLPEGSLSSFLRRPIAEIKCATKNFLEDIRETFSG